MITDPIANALNQIKIGCKTKKKFVVINSSKLIESILQIMKEEGYILEYITKKNERNIAYTSVYLKYKNGVSAILEIKRISKPSFRKTTSVKNMPIVLSNMGTAIISTSKGVLCDKVAKKLNVGGEVIAHIW